MTAGAQAVFDIDQTVGVDTYLQLFDTDDTTLLVTAGRRQRHDPGSRRTLRDSTSATHSRRQAPTISASTATPATSARLSARQFTLNVSLSGATLVTPTAGSRLNGGSGADTVYGSSGNDRFIHDDGLSSDNYYAGSGIDSIDYSRGDVPPVPAPSPSTCRSSVASQRRHHRKAVRIRERRRQPGRRNDHRRRRHQCPERRRWRRHDLRLLGDDTMDGGAGIDTLSYALDQGVTVSLAINAAQNTGSSGLRQSIRILRI